MNSNETFSKLSKGLRQCRDDVDLREKERQNSSSFRVECYHLSGDVYSPTTPVRFKPWDGERPAFWVLVEENKDVYFHLDSCRYKWTILYCTLHSHCTFYCPFIPKSVFLSIFVWVVADVNYSHPPSRVTIVMSRKLGGISPLLCCHPQNTGHVPNTQKMFYDTSDWENTLRKEQSHMRFCNTAAVSSRQQWDSMKDKWRLDSQMGFYEKKRKFHISLMCSDLSKYQILQ